MRVIFVVGLLVLAPSVAWAEDFYVDPAAGSMDGDGSMERPWRTLEEVVAAGLIETQHWAELPYAEGATLEPVNPGAPVGAGDTIWLASGYHGELVVRGAYNDAPITIAAMEGATPELRRASLTSVRGWVLRGLSISPSHAPTFEPATVVQIESHGFHGPASDVVVDGCTIVSVESIEGFDEADWEAQAANGVISDADDVVIRDNEIRNVRFGISMSGRGARVLRNRVINYAGDGMRGLGDDGVFEGNYVANCYHVGDNHDDGFQSWSVGTDGVGSGEVRGIVLRGNVFVNYTDPAQPLRATVQGIGCFDGFFVDWVVENNVIITDHWHGITLLGARDSRIVNNTVIDLNGDDPGPPWIRVAPHKDGTPSENVVVRNNLTTALNLEGDGVAEDHNLIVEDPSALFVAPPYDLHLLAGAPAIDVGSADLAPATDADGIARPQGTGVDVGAYEWHEPGVGPVDAGPRIDGGAMAMSDAGALVDGGNAPDDPGPAGCGCSVPRPGGGAPIALAILLGVGLLARRRR